MRAIALCAWLPCAGRRAARDPVMPDHKLPIAFHSSGFVVPLFPRAPGVDFPFPGVVFDGVNQTFSGITRAFRCGKTAGTPSNSPIAEAIGESREIRRHECHTIAQTLRMTDRLLISSDIVIACLLWGRPAPGGWRPYRRHTEIVSRPALARNSALRMATLRSVQPPRHAVFGPGGPLPELRTAVLGPTGARGLFGSGPRVVCRA